ncbi:hypothetical protein ACFVUY_37920 [Kitasatospora sp. NPDC058063]|uniref:hypothetical protein n=1 Tax=unclassified Kitasatospora TaxID=2633591 RepID=UPI0036DA2E06
MDDMFAASLAKRGQGANVLPQQGGGAVPPTFLAPGDSAANRETAPIGVEVFDKDSNTRLVVTQPPGSTEAAAEASKGGNSATPTTPLTPEEVLQLTQAENRIKAFGKAAADAGEAYAEIRDNHLQRHYGLTWAEYCPKFWGLSASQVDRFIRAAPVMRALGLPNEATARELSGMFENWGATSTQAVWQGAVEGAGGKGTAKAARIAVQSITESLEEGAIPPDPGRLSQMARKAVEQAVTVTSPRPPRQGSGPSARPNTAGDDRPANDSEASRSADESRPDTTPGTAWIIPAEALRELTDLITRKAQAKGTAPGEEIEYVLDVLLRHYDAAAVPG